MRSKYSGAEIGGTGPISATLLPPGDDPPCLPSVNSHALPSTWAASAVGPAAACAWASVGKLSMRQNKGPGGSCETFFSAIGLISNFAAAAIQGDNNNPDVATAQATSARLQPDEPIIICVPPFAKPVVTGSVLPGKSVVEAADRLFSFRLDIHRSAKTG